MPVTREVMHTFLLVYQEVNVCIDGDDDHIGQDVDCANDVQDIGVLERDFLGDLHHPEDDDQVGTAVLESVDGRERVHEKAEYIWGDNPAILKNS